LISTEKQGLDNQGMAIQSMLGLCNIRQLNKLTNFASDSGLLDSAGFVLHALVTQVRNEEVL
jgi:hypothetical protein